MIAQADTPIMFFVRCITSACINKHRGLASGSRVLREYINYPEIICMLVYGTDMPTQRDGATVDDYADISTPYGQAITSFHDQVCTLFVT